MIKFEKKQIKFISIGIALVFVFSVVALAVSQSSVGFAAAGNSSNVGVVNHQLLVSQHPDMAAAKTAMEAEVEQAKKDFETKSKTFIEQTGLFTLLHFISEEKTSRKSKLVSTV